MNKNVMLLMVLCCMMACEKKPQVTKGEKPTVMISEPLVQNVILSKQYPGYLKAEKTVKLVARVDGFIQESYLVPGARVKKGDLIFVINPDIYLNNVKQNEAQLVTSKAQYAYAKSNYERMKEASQTGAVSEIQVLQAESTMQEQEASIKSAQAALDIAKINHSYCYVHAPFSGHISLNTYDVGNYVSGAAQPITLATLFKDDVLYVYYSVAEQEYVSLLKPMISNRLPQKLIKRVFLEVAHAPDLALEGRIDYLSPSVNLSTGTVQFRAVLSNQAGYLKDGMIVTVRMPYAAYEDAILIDDAAIGTDQLGKYVYVVNDSNVVKTRHVVVGEVYQDTLRHVLTGLSAGERYVTVGLLKVRNGMEVNPVKR